MDGTSGTGSLSIEGITVISDGASLANEAITAYSTTLDLHNFSMIGVTSSGTYLVSTSQSVGTWENVLFRDCATPDAASLALMSQPVTGWSFVNISFDSVRSAFSAGIMQFITAEASDPTTFNFGGDISFTNCSSQNSNPAKQMDSAITIIVGPIPTYVVSIPANPSRFIVKDSDVSLFLTLAPSASFTPRVSVEVGSVVVDSPALAGASDGKQRYIFQIDRSDSDNVGTYTNLAITSSFSVLQDIVSVGMGIASRGYGYSVAPSNLANNVKLKIGGDLNFTIDGDISSAFRLTWPMDISAASINANLMPRDSDGLVPTFLSTQYGNQINLESTREFIITSSNTPYQWGDSTAATPTPSTAPITPYSSTAPLYLNTASLIVNITGESFIISHFSLPRSSTFVSTYQGAAITVLQSTLLLTTTGGDISFIGNQNVGGSGGALYIAALAPGCTLTTNTAGRIIFQDNVAYYGGAIFVDPSAASASNVQLNSDSIQFLGNTAIEGGGATLMPHTYLSSLLPASKTVLGGNGAGHFGCVFGFNLSPSTSDVNDANCASGTYAASLASDNYRFDAGYSNATYCTQYEQFCFEWVAPPVSAPVPLAPTANPPSATPTTTANPTPQNPVSPVSPVPITPVNPVCPPTTNLPPNSYCVNGVYQTTSQSFTDYVESGTTSNPAIIDAPLFIAGGNVSLSAVTVANVLHLPSGVAVLSSNDCISVDTVSVSLSKEDINQIASGKSSSALLIQSSCSSQNTNILVVGASPKKSCQKVKVTPKSTANSLQATFTISSSKCDTWWIILVSVIGGVLIFVIVTIVVVRLMPAKYRRWCQPFHKIQDAPSFGQPRAYSNIE